MRPATPRRFPKCGEPNKQTIQVIVGAKAESIGDEMKKSGGAGTVVAAASADAAHGQHLLRRPNPAVPNAVTIAELVSGLPVR